MEWGTHLAAQADALRTGGSRVEIILPDANSQNALGVALGMMDPSTRGPSAQAGYDQVRALAEKLADFWR
jgi:NTE family protein